MFVCVGRWGWGEGVRLQVDRAISMASNCLSFRRHILVHSITLIHRDIWLIHVFRRDEEKDQ